ncbi:MAG: NAD(P)-dependent alcohol dehydrogenase [Pseudomonadota bacterium]
MQVVRVQQPGGLDKLLVTETEARDPGPGEVQVEVAASSLNFHDYAVVIGLLGVDEGRVPMSDGAGVVTAIGEGVDAFQVGDRVMSTFFPNWADGRADDFRKITEVPGDMVDGYAARSVTYREACFTRMPEGYSFAEAATLPCAALTAWRALMVEARIKAGETVLVQGSGGVSVFALQFAKAAGCEVIATSGSDAKLERLGELGAAQLINYRETPEWGDKILELTGGRGVDVVVEVGGSGTVAQSVRAVGMGGHISMIGVLTGFAGEVPLAELFQKNAVLSGITVGSRAHQLDMISAIEANQIKPVIDRSYPLAQIADAFSLQESQQHFGKICLDIT